MKIGSRNSADFTVSTVRQERIQRYKLDGLDYSDADAVQKARDAITYMGHLDAYVDSSEGGEKRETLERFADLLLCEKAASWQEGGSNRVPCEKIAKLDRREVQTRFLEMLSPEQRRAILATPQETDQGIRFSPDTKTELDNLLSITFPSEEGRKLLQSGDVAEAWLTARTHELDAAKWRKEAQDLQSNGSHPLAAKAWKQAAEHFSASGKSVEAAEAYEQAASDFTADSPERMNDRHRLAAAEALGAAAEHWHDAGRHDNAAMSRHRQAEYLTKLGMQDEAVHCTEIETLHRKVHDSNSAVDRLPPEMLLNIASRLTDSASFQAFALVNSSWNSSTTPLQNRARTVANLDGDKLLYALRKEWPNALDAIKRLPPSLQLGPFLQLADTIIDKSLSSPFDRSSDNALIYRFIYKAAVHLEPGDKRKLLTKLVACVPYMSNELFWDWKFSDQERLWRECFDGIREINAAQPRDKGPAVTALATNIPATFLYESKSEFASLRTMIAELEDGDPHKKQAQSALVHRLYTTGRLNSSEKESLDSIFPKT